MPDDFFGRVTGDIGKRTVHPEDHVIGVGDHDAFLRFESDRGDVELVFGLFAFADIGMCPDYPQRISIRIATDQLSPGQYPFP